MPFPRLGSALIAPASKLNNMSRRKQKFPKNNGTSAPSASFGYGGGFGGGSGYTAGDQSTARGYVYFPNLDSKTSFPSHTRTEITRKSRWLEGNDGTTRHIANTLPMLVGPLTPQPATSDPEFNRAALAHFMRTQGSRMIHDQAGMENFFDRQKTIVKRDIVDGDCLIVLTQTTTGNARTAFYEAPQIGNGAKQTNDKGWFDGVQIDKWGKRKAYCILKPGLYNREGEVIPASAVLHCGRFETPQSPRGLTGLIHAINHLLDIREIKNDIKRGIKAANLVGFYLTNEALSNMGPAPASGNFQTKPYNGRPNAAVPNPKPVKFEEITEGGGNFMTLAQGQDLKTVNDSRPHPNAMAFNESLVKDIANGIPFPYEALFSISGISGPAVRFIMRMAEKSLNVMRDQLREQFCQPYWNYTIALGIRNGQIPAPKDPDWWKCNWIAPSSLTIDVGRESTAGINEINAGLDTMQQWCAEDSKDWREVQEQRAIELANAIALELKHKLPEGSMTGSREFNQPKPEDAKTPPKPAK